MTRRIVLPVLALSLLAALPALAGNKKDLTLTSPGGAIRAEIKAGGKITYAVSYGGKRILDESEIALKLGDGTVLGSDRKVRQRLCLALRYEGEERRDHREGRSRAVQLRAGLDVVGPLCPHQQHRHLRPAVRQLLRKRLPARQPLAVGFPPARLPARRRRCGGRREGLHHRVRPLRLSRHVPQQGRKWYPRRVRPLPERGGRIRRAQRVAGRHPQPGGLYRPASPSSRRPASWRTSTSSGSWHGRPTRRRTSAG